MARPAKKNVYKRIEDKNKEILKTEELLAKLNNELKELQAEKDDLEMHQLLEMMKSKGLTINEALSKFESESMSTKEAKSSKTRNKKVEKEVIENTEE